MGERRLISTLSNGVHSPDGGGGPGREAAQSPPYSVEDKNKWRYTYTSHIRLHGVGRDNCPFTLIFTSLKLDTKRT